MRILFNGDIVKKDIVNVSNETAIKSVKTNLVHAIF